MTNEPNNTPAAASKSKPVSKSAKLTASDIPAAEWEELVKLTGTDIPTVGKAVRAVAAFCATHAALSARDMAAYMAANYTAGALSHSTIAQHKRLDQTLTAAIDSAMLSDELYGMARSVLGLARYSWERWEAALKWESVTASTHAGERSALAAKLIRETYTAAKSESAQKAAEAERAAEREAAKLKRETAKAEAEAAAEARIAEATAELQSEVEALRASTVTPGEAGSWEALTRLLGGFLPHAADMPRHTGAALAALMAAAGSSPAHTAPEAPAAPAPRKRGAQSKPRELQSAA